MGSKEKVVVRNGNLNLDISVYERNHFALQCKKNLAEVKLNEAVGREIDVNNYDDMHGLFIEECQQKPIKVGKKGKVSFAKDVIMNWDTPFTKDVISIKEIKGKLKYFKIVEKYISGRTDCETFKCQKIPFELTVGSTGRLHARNTSVMSFPDGLRECIIPDPGCVFFGFDYVAQKLCIMAYDVKCQRLIDDVRNGTDVFENIVKEIEGIDWDKVKSVIDAYLYGSKITSIANKLFIDEKIVEKIFEVLFWDYPELQRWKFKVEEIKEQGHSYTITGRECNIDSDAIDIEEELRRAANFRMQGSGADILNEVIDKVDKDSFLTYVISVYDSIIVQVHLNNAMMKTIGNLEEFMESRLSNSFKVKVAQGNNWLEAMG